MKVTRAVREGLKTAAERMDFDVDTVVVHRDGMVSAVKDADKTFDGPHFDRLFFGYVEEIVEDDGKLREPR